MFYRPFTGVGTLRIAVFSRCVYMCPNTLFQVTEGPLDLPVTEDLWVFLVFQDLRDHKEGAVRTSPSGELVQYPVAALPACPVESSRSCSRRDHGGKGFDC